MFAAASEHHGQTIPNLNDFSPPTSWMAGTMTVITGFSSPPRPAEPQQRTGLYTRIGISTYSALESPASWTTVGAWPSENRNST